MDVSITIIKEETAEKLEMVSTSTLSQGDGNEADEEQSTLEITVSTNDPPPDKPDKPCGPVGVKNGTMCAYTTELNSQHQHKICYNFSWGDGTHSGWTMAHNCGEKAEASHKWNKTGNYTIKAKARYEHYHEESEWSEPLEVTVSTNDPPPNKPEKPSGPTRARNRYAYAYSTKTMNQN